MSNINEIEFLYAYLLNPNQGGLFGRSIWRGGVESAHRTFWASKALFYPQISPNRVSDETLDLYTPIETLSNILWTEIFPEGIIKVT